MPSTKAKKAVKTTPKKNANNSKPYTPPQIVLERYADVLINAALGDGEGIKKGQVVVLNSPECAKPLLVELYKSVLKAGGHPITRILPDGMARLIFQYGSDEQLDFFPKEFGKGLIAEADHWVSIIAETDKEELKGIPGEKVMRFARARKPMRDLMDVKENAKKFTWTLALYGTPAMAKDVGMSEKAYWNEIIKACYLDDKNPVEKTKRARDEINRVAGKLNSLKIDSLHIVAPGTDLTVGLHAKSKWIGGTGRNIPSFEIFTSPDARRTEGHITFTEPLFRYGNKAEKIALEFKEGKVVKATAKSGIDWLQKMIAEPNANRVGEYSLTDGRLSRITKYMGETLFDENVGGRYGNTHLALGKSYHDCYDVDASKLTEKEWAAMGFNDSPVHTDIVATSDRTVTATLQSGKKVVIYKDGKFTV